VRFAAGRIVLVDWRDALPREASERGCPAVVVKDDGLFDEAYPNAILVPLAEDPHLAIADLSVPIAPSPQNGCTKPCHALAHHVTATSEACILRDTGASVTADELRRLHRPVAFSLGLEA